MNPFFESDYGANFGLYTRESWGQFIDIEHDVWNEKKNAWETDDDEEDGEIEMDNWEMRAIESLKYYKNAFDSDELKLRKRFSVLFSRTWFLATRTEERLAEIEKIEKRIHKKQEKKKQELSRKKLFKRLNKKFRKR